MKLSEAQLPFRDRPFQVFSITSWVQMALGILALMVVFTLVRPIWERIQGMVSPLAGRIVAVPSPMFPAGQTAEYAEDPIEPVVRILQ